MPVTAKTRHQGQVLANGVLVLKIQCPDPGRTVIVKVEIIRLDIVVHLLLLNILAEFGAERDLVSFEEDSGSIALKIPPAAVGSVVVLRVRRDAFARIVVNVDSVIVVPIVGGPSQRLPGSERVMVLDIDVTTGIGGSGP